ncbi:hypothetical protein [Hymenobacter metallilatus]|uniref:Uncharacterized protein n=1 Tax=Hymenobacter metallilatus TaxID=2493666 RepID=A0A428J0J6_9BACT|nr:hypothetical protein [Hymenobacter metallilatus]RSK25216.1 hypothetical protein EI290_17485 [Hymenobacter metallilatus]
MIQKLGIILLLIGLTSANGVAQSPRKVTRLRIVKTEFLGYREYVITDSTIRVEIHDVATTDSLLVREITSVERNQLLAPLDQVYLSGLKNSYQGKSTDTDMPGYTFMVVKGSFAKQINLYEYRLRCLYDVSVRLDALLPEAFRLNYATYTAK